MLDFEFWMMERSWLGGDFLMLDFGFWILD